MVKTKFNLEKEVTKLDTKVLDKLTRDNFKPTCIKCDGRFKTNKK